MLWYVARLQSHLIAAIALQDASLYAQALTEFRTLYTSEVVETVRAQGIDVTHDYLTHAGAIPLPVTLTMLVGKRISAHATGAQIRLYSPYPFPAQRAEGGLRDAFGQAAWDYLQRHPDRYYEGPGGCLSGTICVSYTLEEEIDYGELSGPSGACSGSDLPNGVMRGVGAQ
jgi:hypothetical protein